MSRVHDILRTKRGSSTRMWYLRISDGSVYGPVQLSVLCDWAAQSRIAPGNQVSEDGKNWIPAEKLSELKMEWTATLPGGTAYGPFNVLAVAHLFENGTLPGNAVLTNKTSGRTLLVEDMLKEESDREADRETAPAGASDDQAELSEQERTSRLLHEAELQQTIDDIQYTASETPPDELFAEIEEEVEVELRDVDVLEKQTQHKEKRLKDGIGRLHSDIEKLKAKLDNAKKQLIKQKKEHDEERRKDLLQRDELRNQTRLLQEKLAATTVELDQSRRLRAEYKGDEGVLRQLERRCETAEKNLKKQEEAYITLEKESLAKQEELLAEIKALMRQAENSSSEIQRVRKELHEQASQNVAREKDGTRKEAELYREAREAGKALQNVRHELDELKRKHEVALEQSRTKEKNLSQRVTQLQNEAAAAREIAEKFKASVPERDAERAELQSRADTAISDLESTKAELQQLREHYEPLQEQVKEQFEIIDQRTAELTREKTLHQDTKTRLQNDIAELERRLDEFRDENTDEASRIQTLSADLAGARKETDRVAKEASQREKNLQSELEKLRHNLDARASRLESVVNELTAERQASENLKQQLHQTQKELELLSKETDRQLAAQKKTYESELKHETDHELALQNRISHLENELQLKASLLEENTKKLKDADTLSKNLETRFSKQEAEYAEQLVQMNEECGSLKNRVDTLNASLEETEKRLAEQQDECRLLKAQSDGKQSDLAERMKQMQSEYRQTSQDAARVKKDLAKKTNECQMLERRLTAADVDMKTLQSELADLRNQYEPMLKEAQKHEKELMNKLIREGRAKPAKRKPLTPPVSAPDGELTGTETAGRRLSITAAVVLMIAVAAFMLGRGSAGKGKPEEPDQQPAPEEQATADPDEQDIMDEPSDMDLDLPPVTLDNEKDVPAPVSDDIEWPDLKINNARVIRDDNISRVIIFDNGLFESMTNLSKGTSDTLAAVADQVRPHMSRFNLIIKGQTDSTPMKSKSTSPDNYALAMARAQVVRDILINRHGFPANAVFMVSAGETDPPYPNDSEESRKKNRTVVLKLVPKR